MSQNNIVVFIASHNSFVHEKYGNQKEDIKKKQHAKASKWNWKNKFHKRIWEKD